MKDTFHTYIQKSGDEISLSDAERAKMRGMLQSYMEMKPVRTSAPTASSWGAQWFIGRRQFATALILILFIGSGGISYAAEGALPGDALYPVKVHINEPVAGALALSSSAKAEWAMSVAGERIKEATTLAAQGRLSEKTQNELQASFEAHSALAIQNIGDEASTSPETGGKSATHFEATLSEYERTLAVADGTQTVSSTLVSAIRDAREHVAEIRVHTERGVMNAARAEEQSASSSAAGEQQGRGLQVPDEWKNYDTEHAATKSIPSATTSESVEFQAHAEDKSGKDTRERGEVQTILETVNQPVTTPVPSFFH